MSKMNWTRLRRTSPSIPFFEGEESRPRVKTKRGKSDGSAKGVKRGTLQTRSGGWLGAEVRHAKPARWVPVVGGVVVGVFKKKPRRRR